MANTISLTAQMSSNLLALQNTAKLMGITQERIASGKKVNSAIDDPVAYFDADAHYARASDFATFKNGMLEGVQTIKQATNTIDSLKAVLEQMKSIATSAKTSTSSADVNNYITQYNTLRTQFDNLQGDGAYKGVNLLANGNTLSVTFNTDGDKLSVSGFDGTVSGLGVGVASTTQSTAAAWTDSANSITASTQGAISDAITNIDSAISTLRTKAKLLATNLGIVNERITFTDKLIANFKVGGDNLTLADMNEEGANMLTLQTRQAMSIQALSIASQSAQQVLQLFG